MSEEVIEQVAAAPVEEKVAPKKYKKVSRKKVCQFCVDHADEIDYKDVAKLKRYITEIVAEEVEFLSTKSSDEVSTKAPSEDVAKLQPIDDDGLPF